MTNKDYELIATSMWRSGFIPDKNKVRQAVRQSMRLLIATDLATSLLHQDPSFDRDKFMKDCGITL